jgi:hypothetical protein
MDVKFHRAVGDSKFACHLFVAKATGDQKRDLMLARRQGFHFPILFVMPPLSPPLGES